MFLKRLVAVIVALILLLQLAACNPMPSADSNFSINSGIYTDNLSESIGQVADNLQLGNGKDENYTDDTSADSNDDTSESHQDVSSNETNESVSSDSDIQDTDKSSQSDNQDEVQNDDVTLQCNHGTEDPYQGMSKTEFYANYTPACCNQDASYRSKHYFLSGSLEVPGQYVKEADNCPKSGDKFIRNTATIYLDNGNTYVVMDANGDEVMRIHKDGGYITPEEVAAYMYAFGGSGKIPANYTTKKNTKPSSSLWAEYLRVNYSYFIGDTNKYPYEPELPDISGCGGSLRYYEMDIGTTGTATPGYAAKPYIQGNKINRGAARLVCARQDLNGNGVYENNEVYVFYTHNHYNDFREYLNYYGGWGEMFGNVTGGGEYSSKTNYNPTPYVPTEYLDFSKQ